MKQIELSAGTIEYEDIGEGPTLVLLHGLLMDSSLWGNVIAELSVDHRCVAPVMPLGAHRLAVHSDADLSLKGMAHLVAELIGRLELRNVTLVGNDTGGAVVQLLMQGRVASVRRTILVSCDAFDNFPPGLTGKSLALLGKLSPRAFGLVMQQMRLRPIRRLPIAFGWLTKRGDADTARWMKPILLQREIRRDAVRMLRSTMKDRSILLDAAKCFSSYDRASLIVWAAEDRVMPPEHGRQLAELLPHGRLVEISDSYALIPLDQPTALANIIRSFVDEDSHAERPG
jgi:pimeloyl-ACP methyl ester carboxylesterase